ncbi:hypothetical protein H4I95_10744 [Botrytis cinerea]
MSPTPKMPDGRIAQVKKGVEEFCTLCFMTRHKSLRELWYARRIPAIDHRSPRENSYRHSSDRSWVADDACGTRVYKAPGSGILRDLDSGLGTFHINIVHDMIWGIELGTCSVDHHVGSRVEENSAHRIRICKISYIIPRSEHS